MEVKVSIRSRLSEAGEQFHCNAGAVVARFQSAPASVRRENLDLRVRGEPAGCVSIRSRLSEAGERSCRRTNHAG